MHNTEPTEAVIKHEPGLINEEIRPSGMEMLV
jgi:hypothetical protein